MSKHKTKVFKIESCGYKQTLDTFMAQQERAGGFEIPFRSVNFIEFTEPSFYSHPLIPEFLLKFGSQIHHAHIPGFFYDVDSTMSPKESDEFAFYQGLPNLIHLSTIRLGKNIPSAEIPFLCHLQFLTIQSPPVPDEDEDEDIIVEMYEDEDTTVEMNVDFLLNCPKLRKLCLPNMDLTEYIKILTELGKEYFAVRNRSGSLTTLSIEIEETLLTGKFLEQQHQTQHEDGVNKRLLQELAAADGRIRIKNMPVTLLDEAIRLFKYQPGKLSSFGKCVLSLIGFSNSLYDVELANMQKILVDRNLVFVGETREARDYMDTISWPKLEEIEFHYKYNFPADDFDYMKELLFGSRVRPSVQRLNYDLELHFLKPEETLELLGNLPNLTRVALTVGPEDVKLFRDLIRSFSISCSKLQSMEIDTYTRLGDEDFLGTDGNGNHPPLLQLSGKSRKLHAQSL
jgi:hypothetical protein